MPYSDRNSFSSSMRSRMRRRRSSLASARRRRSPLPPAGDEEKGRVSLPARDPALEDEDGDAPDMLAMLRLEMLVRFSRNQSMRFLKPGTRLMVDGSSVRVAYMGMRPTSERTGICCGDESGPHVICRRSRGGGGGVSH